MRTINKIHRAAYKPIADLVTYSPLPSFDLDQIDPFLFLNHHGPQKYMPNNNGLPFGPHPHRGMETVTFILEGDIMHRDSSGHESVINAGGVQWMTAGKGLIHAEVSSDQFKEKGGDLEIMQLWINLPAAHKMTDPKYIGLQKKDIPEIAVDDGNIMINLIAGQWNGHEGAFQTISDIFLSTIRFRAGSNIKLTILAKHNVFFYVIRGALRVNEKDVAALHLVEFNNNGETIDISAREDSILLFGHAMPFNEPVVAQGPFVMNTQEEIRQAYEDYRLGKFGSWE